MEKIDVGHDKPTLLIDRCVKGDGLWFDRGELNSIIARAKLDEGEQDKTNTDGYVRGKVAPGFATLGRRKVFFLFLRKRVALSQVFVLKCSDYCRAGKLQIKSSGQSRVLGNTSAVTVQIVRREQSNLRMFYRAG